MKLRDYSLLLRYLLIDRLLFLPTSLYLLAIILNIIVLGIIAIKFLSTILADCKSPNSRLSNYSGKYLTAFSDHYGEMIRHPPPTTLFSLLLYPYLCTPLTFHKVSLCYAQWVFWVENIVMVLLFFFLELLMLLPAYFRMFLLIMRSENSFAIGCVRVLTWLVLGIYILFFFVLKDVLSFITILSKVKH